MPEATAQEGLFRAFESQPGNYRLTHHPTLGNVLLAAHAQVAGLKVFNFRNANVGAKHNVMEVFNDLEKPEPLEYNHIK